MTRARDVANLIGSGNYSSTTFTATAGQTAFTISHTQGFVQVFMNGLLLDETVDYTSNGSAVTLTSGAAAGDEIEVVAYNTFSVGDALNQAAADTRYVNTSGDTMSGNLLLSSGSVGVGTTSPLRQLHISNTSGNSEIAFTSGTSGVSSILFGDGLTGTDVYKGYLQYNHAQDKMLIATAAGSSINIDSSGRVTMPNQPSFFVQGNFGWVDTGSSYTEINPWYTSVTSNSSCFHNDGSHFNLSNGRFTAPIAGRYQFNISAYVNNTGDAAHGGRIYVNGSVLGDTLLYYRNTDSGYPDNTMSASYVIKLAVNDYVSYYHTQDIYGYHSHFSGYLIG